MVPADLFRSLSDEFSVRLGQWDGGAGFAAIRTAWLARAAGLGQRIVVRLPTGEVTGVFEALGQDGSLLLREDGGACRTISAGEVFFPADPSQTGEA